MMNLYSCGPTVYDDSHIGHARNYISIDLINRTMNNILNKPTNLIMNITDIDDKIINKAEKCNNHWRNIVYIYEKKFFESMDKINVKYPDIIIRVSESLPLIISYIQKIIDNKFAYIGSDNSIYFDTNYYLECGYILGKNDNGDNIKKNKNDFVLWKSRNESEIGFDANFVINNDNINIYGRPGWHIECSAMINKYTNRLDIHFGGIDLKFPHHQNEQMQAHAFYHPKFLDDKWVDKFIHVEHLCVSKIVDDKIVQLKMGKSLKNFITIDEILQKINSNQLRWMFVIHNWNKTLEYNNNTENEAKLFDKTIVNFFDNINNFSFNKLNIVYHEKEYDLNNIYLNFMKNVMISFDKFHFDEFYVQLKNFIKSINLYMKMENPNYSLVTKITEYIDDILCRLGFSYYKNIVNDDNNKLMNVLVKSRSDLRNITRNDGLPNVIKQKIYKILDDQRNIDLVNIGIKLNDTKDSSVWNVIQ